MAKSPKSNLQIPPALQVAMGFMKHVGALESPAPDKRQPLVIDRWLRNGGTSYVQRRTVEHIRSRMRVARRFVLDEKAIDFAAKVIREVPDLLAQHQQFARPPYDTMWIEIPDYIRFWEGVTGDDSDDKSDTSLGYLIDHDKVYCIAGGSVERPNAAALMQIAYNLHTPWTLEESIEFADKCGCSRSTLDDFFWGANCIEGEEHLRLRPTRQKALPPDVHRALRAHHSAEWLPMDLPSRLAPNFYARSFGVFYNGGSGELRNIIALLLLMNRPSVTRYVRDVPQGRGFIKGKVMPFMGYSTVTIDLDPVPAIRRIGTPLGDAEPKRRHEVKATWCHDEKARLGSRLGCPHDYRWDRERYPDDDPNQPNHFLCHAGCGGFRWRRKKHLRGDASKGWVQKEAYAITASGG